jgi:hypothetical protein
MQVTVLRPWLRAIQVLVLAVAPAASGCSSELQERTYDSPNSLYSVHLRGAFSGTTNPVALTRVSASIHRANAAPIDMGTIFDADWFDTSFDKAFPNLSWIAPRVFCISRAAPGELRDEIVLRNASRRTIQAVSIVADDIVLVVDVEPNAAVSAPVASRRSGSNWYVRARARLDENTTLDTSGHVRTAAGPGELNRLAVVVSDRAISLVVATTKRTAPQ